MGAGPPNREEAKRQAERILDDTELFDNCLRFSCIHRNGFVKLVLSDVPGVGRTRLHFWPTERRQYVGEDIHSHRWRMCSTVLLGQFEERRYRVIDGGQDFVGAYSKNGDGDVLESVRPVTIHELGRRVVFEGDDMASEPGDYHRFGLSGSTPGMTLVWTGVPRREFSFVARFAGSGITIDHGHPVGRDALRTMLSFFVEPQSSVGDLAAICMQYLDPPKG